MIATGRPDEPRIRCKSKKLPKPVVRARILKVACAPKVKLLKNVVIYSISDSHKSACAPNHRKRNASATVEN